MVIVPIYWRKRQREAGQVLAAAEQAHLLLTEAGLHAHTDATEALSPGQKYRLWEGRRVTARVEIGPKDAALAQCVVAKAASKAGDLAAKQTVKVWTF